MLRVVLLLVACVGLHSGGVSAQQKVRLMANTSPPYAGQDLPERGLALELVKHIYTGTGYQPEIAIENWSRSLAGARLGVYDGLAAAWYSDERNKDLMFSEPYLGSELIIVKLRDNQRSYGQLRDLAGGRLGIQTDYAYGVDFDAVPDLRLVQENHLIQLLLKLLNGSVDFVIGDQRTINLQLHEYLEDKITRFEVVGIDLPDVGRHVAASRDWAGHEKMIAAFNSALAKAREDGSVQAIISKWDQRYGGVE